MIADQLVAWKIILIQLLFCKESEKVFYQARVKPVPSVKNFHRNIRKKKLSEYYGQRAEPKKRQGCDENPGQWLRRRAAGREQDERNYCRFSRTLGQPVCWGKCFNE